MNDCEGERRVSKGVMRAHSHPECSARSTASDHTHGACDGNRAERDPARNGGKRHDRSTVAYGVTTITLFASARAAPVITP